MWKVFLFITCVKLLLIPTYRSTDFEVHRNWLAITHSLPLKEWYIDETSEWTLDYPPFFAWFEYLLSQIAAFVDPGMLQVSNLNYQSSETVYFQRLTVIVTDLVLALGIKKCSSFIRLNRFRKSSKWKSKWGSPSAVLQILVTCNVGLLIVDHIHFQYNGLLMGILLLSVGFILEKNYIAGAICFSILLNMKHIFLYMAPVYGIYLLRNYCLEGDMKRFPSSFHLVRFIKLGAVVLLIFFASFGPFIALGQLSQVLSRLFPFKRGLCHSYWAPNWWAVYTVMDKGLTFLGKRLGYNVNISQGSMTSGLVKEYSYSVLPSIPPIVTFILTVLSILPCLWKLWRSPGNPIHFVRCLVICSSCAFIFGWHVHEKAIIMTILPFSLTSVLWKTEARLYLILSTVGHYSLLPLLFTTAELPIKLMLFVYFTWYSFKSLSDLFGVKMTKGVLPLLSKFESWYLYGLGIIMFYENTVHRYSIIGSKYPFLPLMITSTYCAFGILYSIFLYYLQFMRMSEDNHKQKTF